MLDAPDPNVVHQESVRLAAARFRVTPNGAADLHPDAADLLESSRRDWHGIGGPSIVTDCRENPLRSRSSRRRSKSAQGVGISSSSAGDDQLAVRLEGQRERAVCTALARSRYSNRPGPRRAKEELPKPRLVPPWARRALRPLPPIPTDDRSYLCFRRRFESRVGWASGRWPALRRRVLTAASSHFESRLARREKRPCHCFWPDALPR